MQLFGGRGVPASLRNINGFGNHTFKFGRPEDDTFHYVKIHFKPDDGIKNLSHAEATRLAGEEPDYHVKDMYNAIERGDFPSWTMYLQLMDPGEAEKLDWNIFDITRTWPQSQYPLRPVGRLTLNRNPENHFADIEQAAFSPANMVPGIGPSADPMLHARMFSYPDAARYRVGPNYQQLPCNRALSRVYCPFQRDGPMTVNGNYGADSDYVRSSFKTAKLGPPDVKHGEWIGRVTQYTSEVADKDFEQPRVLWGIFKETGEDKRFVENIAAHLGKALPEVQERTVEMFGRVDKEVAEAIEEGLKKVKEQEGGAGIEHSRAPRVAGSK